MPRKNAPASARAPKPRFSKRFNAALAITHLTDAMVRADGWSLDQFVEAPPWLRQLYNRHADAAYRGMVGVERETGGKPV